MSTAERHGSQSVSPSAEAWLSLIDKHEFQGSWRQSGARFRDQVAEQTWCDQLAEVRGKLGPLITRQLGSEEVLDAKASGIDAPLAVLKYRSKFAQSPDIVEQIAMEQQADGSMKVVGYYLV